MKLSLKDALFLGFCAVFILVAKVALRLHLRIPGHSMFFTLFFLLIARGCVQHRLAASFSGLLAGLMAMVMGLGKGGPLILIKYIMPALVVDLMAGCLPGLFLSVSLCMLTAALAAVTRFFTTSLIDLLAGMQLGILIQHAVIKSMGNMLFAIAGSVTVPTVIHKLKAYGAIGEHR